MTSDDPELSASAKELFADPANQVYLSAVSVWEIGAKYALGRLTLPAPPERFIPAERKRRRIESLPLEEEAALHSAQLPLLHKDPFDRMLVCQAIMEGLAILTPDERIRQYGVRTVW